MKICVYFNPKAKFENYDGTRLRKCLKGSLELNDIPYAKGIYDSYDVAHFISLDDELKIDEVIALGKPVVFSALYCESDPSARISSPREENLSLKAIRVLNKVNLVLVSDELAKSFLISHGVKTKIEVISSGVNMSRFEFSSKIEEELFYKYFQLENDQKFIVTLSNINNKEVRKKLISIASLCPDITFFAFGDVKLGTISRIRKSIPRNLRVCPRISNEIYCSMMLKANAYLSVDNTIHCPIIFLDAAASKTPIIALEPTLINSDIFKKLHAHIAKSTNEIALLIKSLIKSDIPNETLYAYAVAREDSLDLVGKKLIAIYKKLMEEKQND